MAQDFAKNRKSGSSPTKKNPARSATRTPPAQDSNHWSWFFSGLFSGLMLCLVGYFSLQQMGSNSQLATDNATGQGEDNSPGGADLQFYEYLPQAEVEVNVVPVEVASTAQEEANPTTYMLQAASFLDPNDAEALRARLILLSLETRIVPTPISGRTWYRVQAGPFVGRNSMQAAENILVQNNIDPIRMRIPGP